MKKSSYHIKQNFVTGLVILLPVVLTVAILGILVNFLTKPFVGIVSKIVESIFSPSKEILFISQEHFILIVSKILVLVALLVVTMALGAITRVFFLNSLFAFGDSLLHKIPIVKIVYKTTQDIIKTLFVSNKNSFKQVVMVPFPKEGMYMLGLIVRESPKVCQDAVSDELVSVLIPTTPNPTTGFLVMAKRSELKLLDIKPEDAIKYVVSCGVIVPCEKK